MSTERIDTGKKIIGSETGENDGTIRPGEIIGSAGESTVRTDAEIISTGEKTDLLNNHLTDTPAKLSQSTVTLNGKKYSVQRLIASSGEAEIFEVVENGRKLVLKYYFSNFKPKEEIVRKLQQMNRRDLISAVDFGYFNNRFAEINEFMAGGTLDQLCPLKDPEKIKDIISQVTEALHACHQHQIIHRDIKPVNIFFRDENRKEVVLGDFGISSALDEGENYKITTAARTRVYAAPELEMGANPANRVIVDSRADYYALGISLLELWSGENPFKGVDHFVIPRLKLEGRVLMPKDLDKHLEHLIKGLITTEPPKRWGYEEIRNWLNGEHVQVYYQINEISYDNYPFDSRNGIIVNNPRDLAYHMEHDPEKGERQLYAGTIKNWISRASPDLASELHDIVEYDYKTDRNAGRLKAIYLLDPYKAFVSFDGTILKDQVELGKHIENNITHFKNDLANPSASLYVFLEARDRKNLADQFRGFYRQLPPEQAIQLIILGLQENKMFLGGHQFENIRQIWEAPENIRQDIINSIKDPDSKISAWLDINYPDLNENLEIFRKYDGPERIRLGYALELGGAHIGDKEIFSPDELIGLLHNDPDLFTKLPDASDVLNEVDFWSSVYKKQTLFQLFSEKLHGEHLFSFDQLKLFLEHFFYHYESHSPLFIIQNLQKYVEVIVGKDRQRIREIVELAAPYIVNIIKKPQENFTYHIEALGNYIFTPLSYMSSYPELTESVIQSLDEMISEYIHLDYANFGNNLDGLQTYFLGVIKYFSNSLEFMADTFPTYQHVFMEKELWEKRKIKLLQADIAEQYRDNAFQVELKRIVFLSKEQLSNALLKQD